MTRRTVAVAAWLVAVSMTAAWAWVIAEGEFTNSMMASLPAQQSRITV